MSSSLPLDSAAHVRWHCRRGMLELDILLLRFFDQHYATLTTAEQQLFQQLLTYPDPDLFTWLMGHGAPSSPELQSMITRIRDAKPHHFP